VAELRYEEAVAKHEPLSAYEKGLVAGIYRYAWMRDGVFYVGTTGRTLGDAVDRALTECRRESGAARPPATFRDLVGVIGDGLARAGGDDFEAWLEREGIEQDAFAGLVSVLVKPWIEAGADVPVLALGAFTIGWDAHRALRGEAEAGV
jgi:hypothetical protein